MTPRDKSRHEIVVRADTPPVQDRASALVQAFLSGRNALTIRAYRQDLADFASHVGAGDADDATRRLLVMPAGDANALVLGYRNVLVERGLRPATVNRRLAALRAMVKLARTLGLVSWSLEVENVKSDHGDMRGPGTAAIRKALAMLARRPGAKARRDTAILRVMHDLGLRRGEVVSLDVGHVDMSAGMIAVLGKGRTARATLTLPPETRDALVAWIEARGNEPGPLFTNFDRAGKGSRLTGTSLYRLVKGLGLGRPHGLRHAAITEALDLLGGDVRRVQRFSRHRDVRVLNAYDDNRQDLAGEVARIVAANLKPEG